MLLSKTASQNVLTRSLKSSTNIRKYCNGVQESKVKIKDQVINYVKVGNGSHPVLCFPGALGTIWSDFKPQIERLDKTKFTIVAWDPPGYGLSRPANRKFPIDFYRQDAIAAHDFMKEIGMTKYSLLGWSDGGISSMILSAKYPEAVIKLIIWGANAYIIPEEIQSYENIRDISKWSDRMKAPLIKLYGSDGLQDMWNGWCDGLGEIFKQGGDICKKDLPLITCPTLIVHGDKDPLVANEHPEYLLKHIKGSKIHRFPDGKHNLHLKYADEFNALITKFLLDEKVSKL